MNLQPNIPKPSRNEVKKYLLKWRQLEKYYNQERALNKLFFDLCPKNDNIEDILLNALHLMTSIVQTSLTSMLSLIISCH